MPSGTLKKKIAANKIGEIILKNIPINHIDSEYPFILNSLKESQYRK